MDIDSFIKQEAGSDSVHDKSYSKALRVVYDRYKGMGREELLEVREMAQKIYRQELPTHYHVASLVIATELLKEKCDGH
jgi:iron-sulfur cluster repair protein YtfE (RIC family)